ncbi:MAG: hypothetical protein JO055_00410 [Alphaproteobacteria bacterium]|nr:hypothetical protein [Alphaproteobacteria bacterium]
MPIRWTLSHAEHLVLSKVTGEVGRAEFEGYLGEIAAAGAMPYRKILDLTFAPLGLSAADVKVLGKVVSDYAKSGRIGAFAIVVDADATREASAIFGENAQVDRPFAIFDKMAEARAWLDRIDPPPKA